MVRVICCTAYHESAIICCIRLNVSISRFRWRLFVRITNIWVNVNTIEIRRISKIKKYNGKSSVSFVRYIDKENDFTTHKHRLYNKMFTTFSTSKIQIIFAESTCTPQIFQKRRWWWRQREKCSNIRVVYPLGDWVRRCSEHVLPLRKFLPSIQWNKKTQKKTKTCILSILQLVKVRCDSYNKLRQLRRFNQRCFDVYRCRRLLPRTYPRPNLTQINANITRITIKYLPKDRSIKDVSVDTSNS